MKSWRLWDRYGPCRARRCSNSHSPWAVTTHFPRVDDQSKVLSHSEECNMFCCRPDWRSSDADDAGGIGPGCRRPPMRTAMRCAPPHPFRRPWLLIVGGGRGIARVRVAIAAEPIHVRAEPAREQHAEDRHPHCPPIRRRCWYPPSRPSTVCIALVWEFPSSSVCKVALCS